MHISCEQICDNYMTYMCGAAEQYVEAKRWVDLSHLADLYPLSPPPSGGSSALAPPVLLI